jgi:hypothetical protein
MAAISGNKAYSNSYIMMMPGNTISYAFNSGHIADENAAVFAPDGINKG